MPLYKKTTSKARVKTQNSFISPLLSQQSTTQNKIKDLIKDDYKENIPIPTKKKLLEPLINVANDGDLLDKLQQKSFKDSSKTFIEVSKTKETWSEKDKHGTEKLTNKPGLKFADFIKSMYQDYAYTSNKDGNVKDKSAKSFNRGSKSKELSKRVSDVSAQSPILFPCTPPPPPLAQNNNKRLKTENSMTITTKIEINSNTDGNLGNTSKTLRTDDDRQSMQHNSKMEDDENEINSSLRSILEDVVNTNIILSQTMMNDGESLTCSETAREKKITKNRKPKTEIDDDKVLQQDEDDELDCSLRCLLDDVVNTNIILSQKIFSDDDSLKSSETKSVIKKPRKRKTTKQDDKQSKPEKGVKKAKSDSKKAPEKSNDNIKASAKSMQNIYALSESTDITNKKLEAEKLKLFKRIQALCSDENVISEADVNKGSSQKNKSTDTAEKLKQKIKGKLKKQKSMKNGNENKSQENISLAKNQNKNKKTDEKKVKANKDLGIEPKKSGGKKLERRKSFTIRKELSDNKKGENKLENKKTSCQSRAKNMIFTSENPKANKMDLDKALKLQEERDVGLYVYCDRCDKVRYLPQCKDPLDLPDEWYCYMNLDPNYNKCTDPNVEIDPEEDKLIIFNKYNAGSIVWAKMDGYPWWPAMVDDDPDNIDYFWLDDEDSTEPSWYHVTFFDSSDVTRAWVKPAFVEPFEMNAKNPFFKPKKYDRYRNRVQFAMREAKAACKMQLLERLRLYSFVTRYFKKYKGAEPQNKKKRDGSTKKKAITKDTQNLVGTDKRDALTKHTDIDNNANVDDNDKLSFSSSEIISNILKTKKGGITNRIASDDEILENIDFNNFMCTNEEAFNTL